MTHTAPDQKFLVMEHEVEVVSIIRNGVLYYTGDTVNLWNRNHKEGQIFEVAIITDSGNPYFVYYKCKDYYFAVAGPGGIQSFGGPLKTEQFRTAVSHRIALFLVEQMRHAHGIDAAKEVSTFSHNRMHTNVLAYVAGLGNWYPIQHNDAEDDDATESKVEAVNSGRAFLTDVVAMTESSPSGR